MSEKDYKQMFGDSREHMIARTVEELRRAIKERDRDLIRDIKQKLKKVYIGDDVFWANEVASNGFVMIVMLLMLAVMLSTIVFSSTGIYSFKGGLTGILLPVCCVLLLMGIIPCFILKGERHWLKYLMMLIVCTVTLVNYSLLGYRAVIALMIPVVLSSRYFSLRFTRATAILMGVFLFLGTFLYANIGVHAEMTVEMLLQKDHILELVERTFMPNLLQFLLIVVISLQVARWGRETILRQAQVTEEFTRMNTELNLARSIQAGMLPASFPAFEDRREFEIYATMEAAREVGGDFFDFFLIDEKHLGIVIADVSGKGVPAALFMMIGKVLIKNQAMQGLSPAGILETVNRQLCENNDLEMFITAWVGILDLDTGVLTAANAGHEYPAICRKTVSEEGDEGYHLYKDRHGFVLAGMETSKYREYQLVLQPGECLFLYTDGVTEANNSKKEFYGEERMLAALNQVVEETQDKVLAWEREALYRFIGEAEQFDDITMLGLRYLGPDRGKTKE
ncbi:MAG: PP2C family protein-serine/threonine phosphatase [Lachnospiraceae bacterium]|nr:PP2C family protein-serine/threonine phosphatase [Lachnospiraceae bacterium]